MDKNLKIGSLVLENRLCLAPMAGATDLAFRTIVRDFGCGLCLTEMVSADGLVRGMDKSFAFMRTMPSDRPLGVQIFGSDPDILAAAAAVVTEGSADLIDINMGCPVKNVTKRGAGAALLRDPERIDRIVRGVRKATPLPLTVKIRAGWDDRSINAPEVALIAQGAGADAIIVHPRTARQGFSGRSDWSLIGQVKSRLAIPVIGNGDIRCGQDALSMMRDTGCDGVMLGRGALGNPWLFRDALLLLNHENAVFPDLSDRRRVIEEHLRLSEVLYGQSVGLKNFLAHFFWYTKGLPNISPLRRTAGSVRTLDALRDMIRRYFDSCPA